MARAAGARWRVASLTHGVWRRRTRADRAPIAVHKIDIDLARVHAARHRLPARGWCAVCDARIGRVRFDANTQTKCRVVEMLTKERAMRSCGRAASSASSPPWVKRREAAGEGTAVSVRARQVRRVGGSCDRADIVLIRKLCAACDDCCRICERGELNIHVFIINDH